MPIRGFLGFYMIRYYYFRVKAELRVVVIKRWSHQDLYA
jgi:hypothetical protein